MAAARTDAPATNLMGRPKRNVTNHNPPVHMLGPNVSKSVKVIGHSALDRLLTCFSCSNFLHSAAGCLTVRRARKAVIGILLGRLAVAMRRMHSLSPAVVNFVPFSFIVPPDITAFNKYVAEHGGKANEPLLWICKPSASRRGNGIFVFESTPAGLLKLCTALAAAGRGKTLIVQQYISNPYLIGGFKFDMRLYALLTSLWPLNCYLHRRGLARFSTKQYDLSTLDDPFSHLTNCSINRHSPTATNEKSEIGVGYKWTLARLMDYLKARGVDIDTVWHEIKRLVMLTILPLVAEVPSDPHCYEILGFDVMLDANCKPWLIEVNRSPAMAQGTPEDIDVKNVVLCDAFGIVGLDKWERGTIDPLPAFAADGSLAVPPVFPEPPTSLGEYDQLYPFTKDGCSRANFATSMSDSNRAPSKSALATGASVPKGGSVSSGTSMSSPDSDSDADSAAASEQKRTSSESDRGCAIDSLSLASGGAAAESASSPSADIPWPSRYGVGAGLPSADLQNGPRTPEGVQLFERCVLACFEQP